MFVICPMSNCGSTQKRDRFLECLSKIAPVTLETEPQCQAYAWFRGAEDNDTVPHQWLRGFEVYESIEANTVAHRASSPYKAFRAAVAQEQLLDRPSDLRFWKPTGIGFLNRPGSVNVMKQSSDDCQYAIVKELTPISDNKDEILNQLQRLASLAANCISANSFWVLDRGEDDQDQSILVFGLFERKSDGITFENGEAKEALAHLEELCEQSRRTTWVECGIGFIGRN